MNSSSPSQIRCREIWQADVAAIIELLAKGFSANGKSRDFWLNAFARLSEHLTPAGFPRYGHLLESEGALVGVLLQIFSAIPGDSQTRIRCNVSSWYVEPAFRSYAALLVSRSLRYKNVVYFNISPGSPGSHTLAILETQGYKRYCNGRFVAVPALAAESPGSRVESVAPGTRPDEDLSSFEVELLLRHAGYGCVSLICSSENRRHPFVFARRRKFGVIPVAHLVYCRDLQDFVRFAAPLGRFLAWRGFLLVFLDSNGPIAGLIGTYSDGQPKYFKGPHPPRLGDMAYSEKTMFGL